MHTVVYLAYNVTLPLVHDCAGMRCALLHCEKISRLLRWMARHCSSFSLEGAWKASWDNDSRNTLGCYDHGNPADVYKAVTALGLLLCTVQQQHRVPNFSAVLVLWSQPLTRPHQLIPAAYVLILSNMQNHDTAACLPGCYRLYSKCVLLCVLSGLSGKDVLKYVHAVTEILHNLLLHSATVHLPPLIAWADVASNETL